MLTPDLCSKQEHFVDTLSTNPGAPLPDLILGASLYFPPIFKAFLLGLVFWLLIHRALRDWIYSGDIWHPTLMDLSLFVICVSGALWLLTSW
ncbi:DUF1656 domain-containing protein [Enterobacillus tribolii]|uniref:DUF1656 domain-containing protein n=1 Tax=Enterobacillus tribolii TaxID=1487935 RepID=UPI000E1C6AA9|nr:DUF1656 domain-containing protein [Enterobacillus tribolii]MBW7984372.1 DUF1656 domain-containing protein [Enterobacillus tribolii]